jgi:folate-dependent phosphoribosylglycinamide formyltransferase PurN
MVDKVKWKKKLVELLLKQGIEIDVIYGKKRFNQHLQAYLLKRKFSLHNQIAAVKKKEKRNKNFFKAQNIQVYQFSSVNNQDCIDFIKKQKYDYLVTALDQILVRRFFSIDAKILNMHYGLLPDIKGMNSTEWTYFVKNKIYITLHFIDDGIDTGKIIHVEKIIPEKETKWSDVRFLVQEKIPNLYDNFFKGKYSDHLLNIGGRLYTYMHPDIMYVVTNKYEKK